MPENVMKIIFLFVIIFGFCMINSLTLSIFTSTNLYNLLIIVLAVSFYPFIFDKYSNLFPFRQSVVMDSITSKIILRSFTQRPNAILSTKKPKNLILIEVESFETQDLGKFNTEFPKSMPFLSSLSNRTLHFSEIESQPYTTWSAAGMLAAQCGFPLVVNNVDFSIRGQENFGKWNKIPCISDFLSSLQYTQKMYCTGSCAIFNMKGFLANHHYHTYDSFEHGINDDYTLFKNLENNVLPDLINDYHNFNRPFNLLILNADTHPTFTVDSTFCPDIADANRFEEQKESVSPPPNFDDNDEEYQKAKKSVLNNNDLMNNFDQTLSKKSINDETETSIDSNQREPKIISGVEDPDDVDESTNNKSPQLLEEKTPYLDIKSYPKVFRSFTCFDRMFHKFYKKLKKFGLNENNTVFAVYGDHLTMQDMVKVGIYYGPHRTLSLFFPFLSLDRNNETRNYYNKIKQKTITYYDIAPTILDMLDVEYSPPFPFGKSVFSSKMGNPPTFDDFKIIYNYLNGAFADKKVHCLDKEGFCSGNEY